MKEIVRRHWAGICPVCNGWVTLFADSNEWADNERMVRKYFAEAGKLRLTVREIDPVDVRSGALTMCECQTEKRRAKKATQPALLEVAA